MCDSNHTLTRGPGARRRARLEHLEASADRLAGETWTWRDGAMWSTPRSGQDGEATQVFATVSDSEEYAAYLAVIDPVTVQSLYGRLRELERLWHNAVHAILAVDAPYQRLRDVFHLPAADIAEIEETIRHPHADGSRRTVRPNL